VFVYTGDLFYRNTNNPMAIRPRRLLASHTMFS
jgi:hypothetical protein